MDVYVALKITTAKASTKERESKILEHLSNRQLDHPGRKHVTTLLDFFEHHGPNGTHLCLVFDVMGPNSAAMFNRLPRSLRPPYPKLEGPGAWARGRYPLWMAKSVLRQTLLGIDFMHKCDVAHGDMQPGNILFSVKDLSSLSESELADDDPLGKAFTKTVNDDGEVEFHHLEAQKTEIQSSDRYGQSSDDSVPQTIFAASSMITYVDLDPPLLIKISDLGGAFFVSEPPAKPVTPLGLRSPELILGEPIGQAQDIWSFGCLIFEFLAGRMMFSIMPPMASDWMDDVSPRKSEKEDDKPREEHHHIGSLEKDDHKHGEGPDVAITPNRDDTIANFRHVGDNSQEDDIVTPDTDSETDDEHILQMADILGPIPPYFLSRFSRSHLYFNRSGEIINRWISPPDDAEQQDIDDVAEQHLPALEAYLDREKGADLDEDEAIIVKGLLRTILQFDPTRRPSASELLAHPWFAEPAAKAV